MWNLYFSNNIWYSIKLLKKNRTKKLPKKLPKKTGPNDQNTKENIDNRGKSLGNLNTGNREQKFYNIYVYFCCCY